MDRQVRYEDVAGLNSRVSWGAVFAGSAIAIAVYLMLTTFLAAVGLSVADANNTDGRSAAWVSLAAMAVAMIGSLFLGGYVTTTLTAGENRQEAIIHGALTWAVVTCLSVWLISQGVKAGVNTMGAAGNIAANATNGNTGNGQGVEGMARNAGVPPERIDQAKNAMNRDNIRAEANDPQNREDARKAAMTAAWVTLGATLISMGSAIWGALAGAGPAFRLFPVAVAERRDVTQTSTTTAAR